MTENRSLWAFDKVAMTFLGSDILSLEAAGTATF